MFSRSTADKPVRLWLTLSCANCQSIIRRKGTPFPTSDLWLEAYPHLKHLQCKGEGTRHGLSLACQHDYCWQGQTSYSLVRTCTVLAILAIFYSACAESVTVLYFRFKFDPIWVIRAIYYYYNFYFYTLGSIDPDGWKQKLKTRKSWNGYYYF